MFTTTWIEKPVNSLSELNTYYDVATKIKILNIKINIQQIYYKKYNI